MRWIWIDSFTEFVSGRRAAAVKRLNGDEEYFAEHFRHFPVMPASLMIEGMAQTAGILVGEIRGFRENVILAKIRNAEFTDYAVPGDEISYKAVVESLDERAAATSGTIEKNGREIGKVDLVFSHVNNADKPPELPDHNFVFTEQFMELLAKFTNSQPNEDRSNG